MRNFTAFPSTSVMNVNTGDMPKYAPIASAPPMMPSEKLFTSISNPGRIFSSQSFSIHLRMSAASGPTIIAPRNCGVVVPTTTPIVTSAPMTAPRWP